MRAASPVPPAMPCPIVFSSKWFVSCYIQISGYLDIDVRP
ncbi:Uncharacterised protein [Bordetella pertussis]|nr:Uncharacterised protein [Bordetella pertussis]CFP61443.1 Uncharacterised protein [Bordetella pertussis]